MIMSLEPGYATTKHVLIPLTVKGILALSICVLAGCGTTREHNYSLVNWPRHVFNLMWGDACSNLTEGILPEMYKFGSSGLCRTVDGRTTCTRQFPPTLNLADAILADLDAANTTGMQPIGNVTIEACRRVFAEAPINHGRAADLGKALVALVIVSVFSNLVLLVYGALAGPLNLGLFLGSIPDALLLFVSLVLVVAIMNYEGGPYLRGVSGAEFPDREIIGIGLWMLLAMLVARVPTSAWLLLGSILLLLPVVLVYVLFLVRTRGGFFFTVSPVRGLGLAVNVLGGLG